MLAVLQVAHLVTWHKQLCYFGAETVGPFFIYCHFLFKITGDWGVFGDPTANGIPNMLWKRFSFRFLL